MATLLLDLTNWDLMVDATGNIAAASAPYAYAQDAASAIMVFLGELYYDNAKGIPYFQNILGQMPSMSFIKQQMIQAALTVSGVVSASVYIFSFTERELSAQVQVTDSSGNISTASFSIGS